MDLEVSPSPGEVSKTTKRKLPPALRTQRRKPLAKHTNSREKMVFAWPGLRSTVSKESLFVLAGLTKPKRCLPPPRSSKRRLPTSLDEWTFEELLTLPGIGPVRAKAIRRANTVDEVRAVIRAVKNYRLRSPQWVGRYWRGHFVGEGSRTKPLDTWNAPRESWGFGVSENLVKTLKALRRDGRVGRQRFYGPRWESAHPKLPTEFQFRAYTVNDPTVGGLTFFRNHARQTKGAGTNPETLHVFIRSSTNPYCRAKGKREWILHCEYLRSNGNRRPDNPEYGLFRVAFDMEFENLTGTFENGLVMKGSMVKNENTERQVARRRTNYDRRRSRTIVPFEGKSFRTPEWGRVDFCATAGVGNRGHKLAVLRWNPDNGVATVEIRSEHSDKRVIDLRFFLPHVFAYDNASGKCVMSARCHRPRGHRDQVPRGQLAKFSSIQVVF